MRNGSTSYMCMTMIPGQNNPGPAGSTTTTRGWHQGSTAARPRGSRPRHGHGDQPRPPGRARPAIENLATGTLDRTPLLRLIQGPRPALHIDNCSTRHAGATRLPRASARRPRWRLGRAAAGCHALAGCTGLAGCRAERSAKQPEQPEQLAPIYKERNEKVLRGSARGRSPNRPRRSLHDTALTDASTNQLAFTVTLTVTLAKMTALAPATTTA